MKTNLIHLLAEMVLHPSISFSLHEVDQLLGSHRLFFENTKMIVKAPSRKWANCLSCGKTHEVTPTNGLLMLSCSESGVDDVIITVDELKSVRFNPSGFYAWLQSQFSLDGNVEVFDNTAVLGQGLVNGSKRLFFFSHDNSTQAREKLYQDHPANQAVIVYLSPTLDSHKGYDINLAEYLVVQDNSLSIDVSSALSVIADTIQATSDGQFAFELVQNESGVVMTGSIFGGQSLPLFGSKKSAFYRILSTLLKVHEAYAPAVQFAHPLDTVASQHQGKKENELEATDLVKSRQLLNSPGKELMYLLLSKGYQAGKTVFAFRRAITQADYDGLSPAIKDKISSTLGNSPEPVKG